MFGAKKQYFYINFIFTLLVFDVKPGYFLLFPLQANLCSDGSLIAAVLKAADGPRRSNFFTKGSSI